MMTFPIPPTLPNGNPAKEKINVFGTPGIGKTHQLFNIALWHQRLGSDALFYGINTDTSWEVLHANPEFEELRNLVYTSEGFPTYQDALSLAKSYHKRLRPQDWLCSDLNDAIWGLVSDEAAAAQAKAKGLDITDMGDLWSDKGGGNDYPLKGWDWGFPNARYRQYANNLFVLGPGHRFIISNQADIVQPTAKMEAQEDKVTKEVRAMFKHLGVKPAGQKEDPSRWNTILHIDSAGEHANKWATGKERWGNRKHLGRKMQGGSVFDVPFEDFFMEYMVEIAGWRIKD